MNELTVILPTEFLLDTTKTGLNVLLFVMVLVLVAEEVLAAMLVLVFVILLLLELSEV